MPALGIVQLQAPLLAGLPASKMKNDRDRKNYREAYQTRSADTLVGTGNIIRGAAWRVLLFDIY